MPALRPGFLHIVPTLMAVLRQFGLESGNFGEDAASFCNYAGQMRYKQPRCAKFHTPTILLLPSFEGCFFYVDGRAHLCNGTSQVPMQTLAVGCHSALEISV